LRHDQGNFLGRVKRMRIIYIGTVEFSKIALERLIELKANIVGVLTQESSKFNADFADLTDVCKKNNIPYKYVKDINENENLEWIKDKSPDIVFCFGFSQIIKNPLLSLPPKGIIGCHPAELPRNRGRHPLIWALALGLDRTASTFLFMDEGADSGDILSQEEVSIEYSDDAGTLYRKVTNVALRQIEKFLIQLQEGTYSRIPQDHTKANYWRKRNKEDGKIDFKMTGRAIYNLVRALTKPYVGAHVTYQGNEIKIWRAVEQKSDVRNIEPGKVLEISNNFILVKCCEGAILLVEHEFVSLPKVGEYLL